MSTDYRMIIRRKRDSKLLGIVNCNQIKSILDSSLSEEIGCSSRSDADGRSLTFKDLTNLTDRCFKRLDELNQKILMNRIMIMGAKSKDAIRKFEEDNACIENDYIPEVKYALEASVFIQGLVSAVVEDQFRNPVPFNRDGDDKETDNVPAYIYNGEDLPKEKIERPGGETYENGVMVWNSDVTLEIEANY